MDKRISDYKSLIFLHIPKAAGTTVSRIIERQYSRVNIFNIDGANVHSSIEEFKNLSEQQRKSIVCVKGHMHFGLHVYLAQPCAYITLLRNPVERIVSHYYYVLRTPVHYLYEQVTSKNLTLDDYVDSGISPELDNGQTRIISGVWGVEDPPSDMLEIAKRNLREHFVVGLTERFDESLILMKRHLGWRCVYYRRENVKPKRLGKSGPSKNTLRLIQKSNEKDLELYAFAKQLFEESLQEEGSSFESEVRMFRLLNRVYNIVWVRLGWLRSWTRWIKSIATLMVMDQ